MLPLELLGSIMLIKIISILLINEVSGTISGLNYMEPIMQKPHTDYPPGEDPCHPLYWYPRQIPEYCNYKIPPKPKVQPVPVPIPVPMPFPPPRPPQPPPMYPVPMPMPMPIPAPMMPIPAPMMPLIPQPYGPPPVPLPYGLPLAPSGPMIPVPGVPAMSRYNLPFQNQMAGMVPGIQGLVTRDGGINVLPFSDAYSDLIEKHKNKMIRNKLKKLINDYERRFNTYIEK